MTTIYSEKSVCAVCGAANSFTGIGSTNRFGSPDLDTRPPEMMRSTMGYWVRECPKCGYVSENVSDPSTVTMEWLQSEQYQTCDGIDFASDLAEKFYRQYLIKTEGLETRNAFFALLHAAWACDDKNDSANSKLCRERAVLLAEKLTGSFFCRDKDTLMVIKADLLRRSGQFEKLLEEYADVRFNEDILNNILAFELAKAKEKDDACYRVSDIR